MKNIAVVTGGSSGIGLALMKDLMQKDVLAVSWDMQSPSESDLNYVHCDVSSDTSVIQALAETVARFGQGVKHPSILINNAGLQHLSPIEDFSILKWNQLSSPA